MSDETEIEIAQKIVAMAETIDARDDYDVHTVDTRNRTISAYNSVIGGGSTFNVENDLSVILRQEVVFMKFSVSRAGMDVERLCDGIYYDLQEKVEELEGRISEYLEVSSE